MCQFMDFFSKVKRNSTLLLACEILERQLMGYLEGEKMTNQPEDWCKLVR